MTEETMTWLKDVFSFPFRGTAWKNRFIIGSAIIIASFLIPILPLIFVYGYVLQVMRQAIEGEELALPIWDDWGRLAVDGLRTMLVGFVYLLPGILVTFGGMMLYFFGVLAAPMADSNSHFGTEGIADHWTNSEKYVNVSKNFSPRGDLCLRR